MIPVLRHYVFKEPNDPDTLLTDARVELLYKRTAVSFAICCVVLALVQKRPWILLFAPAEYLLSKYFDKRFERFCGVWFCFITLIHTLGVLTYGVSFLLLAAEQYYKLEFRHGAVAVLVAGLIWILHPFTFLVAVGCSPALYEGRADLFLVRVPFAVVTSWPIL